MLILDSQKVSHCRIQSKKRPAGYEGLKYRDLLFVKARYFPGAKRIEAVRMCQEALDEGRFCILLKDRDRDRYVLCYQVQSTKSATPKAPPAPQSQPVERPEPAPAQPVTSKRALRRSPRNDDSHTILQRPQPAAAARKLAGVSRDDSRTILQRPQPVMPG